MGFESMPAPISDQGGDQPNTAGKGAKKNFRWGQIYIIVFKVGSEK